MNEEGENIERIEEKQDPIEEKLNGIIKILREIYKTTKDTNKMVTIFFCIFLFGLIIGFFVLIFVFMGSLQNL